MKRKSVCCTLFKHHMISQQVSVYAAVSLSTTPGVSAPTLCNDPVMSLSAVMEHKLNYSFSPAHERVSSSCPSGTDAKYFDLCYLPTGPPRGGWATGAVCPGPVTTRGLQAMRDT